MGRLEKEGYICQPHTSAGRIPTEKGYRYYVDNLGRSQEAELEEKKIREWVSSKKGLEKILKLLASISHNATTFWVTPSSVRCAGLSETLAQKDFENQVLTSRFARIIDNLDEFIKSLEFENKLIVKTYIGKENPYKFAQGFATIVTCFPLGNTPCVLGVIGPLRMPYKKIIPLLYKISEILSKNPLLAAPEEDVYGEIYWKGGDR